MANHQWCPGARDADADFTVLPRDETFTAAAQTSRSDQTSIGIVTRRAASTSV